MNFNEMHQQKEKDFNLFLEAIGLVKDEKPLVSFDSIQPYDDNQLMGELLIKSKTIKNILTETLKQTPKQKKTGYSKITSFKIKGKGWIVLEEFEDSSFMTLLNKWW